MWPKSPEGMLAIAFIKRDKTALPSRLVCLCSGSSSLSAARVEKEAEASLAKERAAAFVNPTAAPTVVTGGLGALGATRDQ